MLRLPHLLTSLQHSPRSLLGAAAFSALAVVAAVMLARRRRPDATEVERRRRERLASIGRITDGTLLDARTLRNEESSAPEPEVLVYRYQLAGLVYECAQDCSRLGERVRGYRIGSPVQVRYDPRNPGDSILVAEGWSGLWLPAPSAPRRGKMFAGEAQDDRS